MQIKVFGCKVNKYYTDKWINSDYLRDKSGVFIASCVVTDNAKRKWIKFVKDTSKEISQGEKMYISGCGAFKDGRAQEDFFELYPELENYKGQIEVLGEDPQEHTTQNSSSNPPPNLPPIKGEEHEKKIDPSKLSSLTSKLKGSSMYTKKFVLIQGGCDSFCTFCLTVIKR